MGIHSDFGLEIWAVGAALAQLLHFEMPSAKKKASQTVGAPFRGATLPLTPTVGHVQINQTTSALNLGPLDFDSHVPDWRIIWIVNSDGRIIEISQSFQDE